VSWPSALYLVIHYLTTLSPIPTDSLSLSLSLCVCVCLPVSVSVIDDTDACDCNVLQELTRILMSSKFYYTNRRFSQIHFAHGDFRYVSDIDQPGGDRGR